MCLCPCPCMMLTIDLPPLSHFMVIGIFGPSVSFTGPLTRQAFARLATRPMDPPATVSTSTSEHAVSGGGWPGDGWGWGKCSVWDEVEGERSGGYDNGSVDSEGTLAKKIAEQMSADTNANPATRQQPARPADDTKTLTTKSGPASRITITFPLPAPQCVPSVPSVPCPVYFRNFRNIRNFRPFYIQIRQPRLRCYNPPSSPSSCRPALPITNTHHTRPSSNPKEVQGGGSTTSPGNTTTSRNTDTLRCCCRVFMFHAESRR